MDRPLDLAVGLVEPDGTERVMPLCADGDLLYGCEQFDWPNSLTFRGYSERHGLRLEVSFHSPFYPQNDRLSVMPVFYVELRLTRVPLVRLRTAPDPPKVVDLFFRIKRPDTDIAADTARIDMRYQTPLEPRYEASCGNDKEHGSTDNLAPEASPAVATVHERILSLNAAAECVQTDDGAVGLKLNMPVTEHGSDVKWRLVWVAHTDDPVLTVGSETGPFRYNRYWENLDAVADEATSRRDEILSLSRQFERWIEQAPLHRARRHVLHLAFQSYLSTTFWCDLPDDQEYFGFWEGNYRYHNTLDVAYNISLFYLAVWPRLLRLTLDRWAGHTTPHEASSGRILGHDMGIGMSVTGQAYNHLMPVEENANYLLLTQAYAHWTGDTEPIDQHRDLLADAARYLLWTDRDESGFPSEGTANTLDDASGSAQFAPKQTYLAIKRVTALEAAADLLERAGDDEMAERCRAAASDAIPKIEHTAWMGDHYAVSIDEASQGMFDSWSGQAMPTAMLEGWDDYSIYTTNGLMYPTLVGQPLGFNRDRLQTDVLRALHETLRPYGCAHTSSDQTNIWISSNKWRDYVGAYLHIEVMDLNPRYWDLLVYSNTGQQSFGYIDAYIGNELAFNPRGVTAFGDLLCGPRLQVDRLDGHSISIDPDRASPQRWPLLPLADWEAGKVPICVVNPEGEVRIEAEIEPIRIRDGNGEGFIG